MAKTSKKTSRKSDTKKETAFRDFCKEKSIDCAKTVIKIVEDEEAKTADRIKGAELIFAYGYGKPTEMVEIDGNLNQTNAYDTATLALLAGLK